MVIHDGGIHHVLGPVLVGREQRIAVISGAAAGSGSDPAARAASVMVAGPLCTGLDVFARAVVLAPPQPGDLVAVLGVGAYGATESMPFFLSHPLPPEVGVARRRGVDRAPAHRSGHVAQLAGGSPAGGIMA